MKKTILEGEWLFVVKDFLTHLECESYILDSENRGFEDAIQVAGPGAEIFKEIRNNARLLFDDQALAQNWWAKIAPLIPQRPNGRVAVGLNDRFRFYRYDVEEKFQPHYDLPFERPNGDQSELTLMVYLNEAYGGGETVFYTPAGVERFRVSPTAGMALVFPHAEYHEGAAVSSGRKYVLRTDVMFSQSRRFVLD